VLDSGASDEIQLRDIVLPAGRPPELGTNAPRLKPKQYISFYSPDEWEEFIAEWAQVLGQSYHQVQRSGGSNDRGLDVVGLLSPAGVDGEWDCFQCKHYVHALTPGDAYAEMLKIMHGVVDQAYTFPRRYRFLAPRGCGPTLTRLLMSPSALKEGFLQWLGTATCPIRNLSPETQALIQGLAESADYEVFKAEEIEDVLTVHRRSPYHSSRFGTPLSRTSCTAVPPQEVDLERESVYVRKLIEVYNERGGTTWGAAAEFASDPFCGPHLSRQREAFFSAEELRLVAREQVPEEVFSGLQTDVYDGVVEVEQMEHSSGLQKLQEVLSAATNTQLSANPLLQITRPRDLKGICHQLANDDRLSWVRNEREDEAP
jgi:hypothetical protein